SYTWDNGVTDGVAFTPTGTTTYIVTGTDANNCSATSSTTVTVNSLPSVMAMSTASTVCAGTSVTLSGMGSATSYTWDNGVTDGVAFTPTGTITYIVTGTDANNCSATSSTTVTVNSLPSVMGMSNDMDNAICIGSSVMLSGMGAVSYTWTGGVTNGVSFTPTATDTYTVTGTDANNCMNTNTVTITVNSLPTVTGMSDDSDNTICAGSMITLSGMGAASYTWTGGVSDAVSFAPAATDTYTVTGTDASGCMNTNTITVTVNALPAVTMSAFGTSVCDNGGPVSLGGGSPAGGMYSGTGVSGNTFDPTGLSGMYLITYTVTDANSCSNSDTASIMVDLCSGITSIKGSSTVKVYPNPANGMVTVSIEGSNSEQITISIVDIQGKQIFNEINKNVTSEFNKQINIEGLAKGAYYIKVTSDNKTEIHKLIVH
ncbi:MAG: hypothetical protein K0S44_1293, partial [Bacteroidetes bacterium]|nr:hypothetical protein [Bacteroidota bacterium]